MLAIRKRVYTSRFFGKRCKCANIETITSVKTVERNTMAKARGLYANIHAET